METLSIVISFVVVYLFIGFLVCIFGCIIIADNETLDKIGRGESEINLYAYPWSFVLLWPIYLIITVIWLLCAAVVATITFFRVVGKSVVFKGIFQCVVYYVKHISKAVKEIWLSDKAVQEETIGGESDIPDEF